MRTLPLYVIVYHVVQQCNFRLKPIDARVYYPSAPSAPSQIMCAGVICATRRSVLLPFVVVRVLAVGGEMCDDVLCILQYFVSIYLRHFEYRVYSSFVF